MNRQHFIRMMYFGRFILNRSVLLLITRVLFSLFFVPFINLLSIFPYFHSIGIWKRKEMTSMTKDSWYQQFLTASYEVIEVLRVCLLLLLLLFFFLFLLRISHLTLVFFGAILPCKEIFCYGKIFYRVPCHIS